MLVALNKGKLSSEQENLEDILTSNVFGALRICNAHDHLLAFLRQARKWTAPTLSNQCLFGASANIVKVDYEFWPRYRETDLAYFAEPDLELLITFDNGTKHKVLVEAKFRSGKSSFEDDDGESDEDRAVETVKEPQKANDQLAKQWAHLASSVSNGEWQPALIFLTADMAAPVEAIAESEAAFKKIRKQVGKDFQCFWLSWRHLGSVVGNMATPLEIDLAGLLEKLDLKFFTGFSPVEGRTCQWTFTAGLVIYEVTHSQTFAGFSPVTPAPVSWHFKQG